MQVSGGLEGESELLKGIYDMLYITLMASKAQAIPPSILHSVFTIAALSLPSSHKECIRSICKSAFIIFMFTLSKIIFRIVTLLQSLLDHRSRHLPSLAIITPWNEDLWRQIDERFLNHGDGGIVKCMFIILPDSFRMNSTRRVGMFLHTLFLSYPGKIS
jgi:hypothetical protein